MASVLGSVAKRSVSSLATFTFCAALSGISGVARADTMEDAMQFYESGHYVHAVDRFRAAALAGNTQAQEILGFMYALGSDVYPGVPRDAKSAAHWFDIAARNGRPVSRYMACAMHSGATNAAMRSRHCFDWVAELGKPGPR